MATFLSKLFKPKWQSKNTQVRLDALNELNPQQDEDHKVIISLAESDKETTVRICAIEKLSDTQVLIKLHKKADTATQPAIEQKLYELANAQSLSIFDLILDTDLLTEMIIKSNQADSFISGLARIESPDALLKIATSSKTSKLRQAAAELIESEVQLNALLTAAKSSDKSVYQITKTKLSELKSRASSLENQKQNLEKILVDIEAHAKTEVLQHYEAKLNNIQARWSVVYDSANEAQAALYQQAKTCCDERILAAQKQKQEADDREKLIQTGGDEQEATLFTLSDTLKRFRNAPSSTNDISAIDAVIKTQENRWLEATRQLKIDKSQAKHYQLLMTEMRTYLKSLKSFSENQSDISSNIEELSKASAKKDVARTDQLTKHLKRALNKVDWPNEYALPDLLEKGNESLGHSAQIKKKFAENSQEILEKVEKLISLLDIALEEKQLKKSSKIHKDILRQLSLIGAKQSERVQNQLTLRVNQLNELRDWQGFASNPRQVALCEAMERLSDNHIEPLEKADKIKAMQREWKSFGGAADQSLWVRFKSASDIAYEPCKNFFDEQGQLKKNNITKREQIITQVEDFISNNDWENADWKAAEKINKQAKIEWKNAYPVDFKVNKSLQSKFNTLVKRFDEKLDTERAKNLTAKSNIVETAKSLIELEDLDQAMNQAKSLQQQWQKIGITSHKQERLQWSNFRKACDQIFARRDVAKTEKREEIEKNLLASNEFCDSIEQFAKSLSEASLEELKSAISNFRKQHKSLPSIPSKALEKQHQRFEAAVKEIKNAIALQENKQLLMEWSEIQRKSTLCRKLFSKEVSNDDNELDVSFESQLPLPKQLELALKELWISVKAGAVKTSNTVSDDQARSLCIACEIAAGIDSPDSERELRMQLQVSRLSEGMSSSNQSLSRESQLTASLFDWYTKVGLGSELFSPLENRVSEATQHLLSDIKQ